MEIGEFIKDRSLIKDEDLEEIHRFFRVFGPLYARKPRSLKVGERMSHFAASLDRADTEEDTRRLINQGLDYMGGVFVRQGVSGGRFDVTEKEAGTFFEDGAVVEICPVCGLGGIPRTQSPDGGPIVAYVHNFQVKMEGLLPIRECKLA